MSLRKAAEEGTANHPPVAIEGDGSPIMVRLHCRALSAPDNAGQFAVVLRRDSQTLRLQPVKGDDASEDQAVYIVELESELATAREHLEAAVEDLGVSNEELQAANEELMSANEELQSTNEELQSTNEELHTVNVENQEKLAELDDAYADIDNLLNTAEPATVFLDKDLRIRRFCKSVESQFELDAHDIGRPLSHFSSKLEADANRHILSDAELVLTTGGTKDYEVRSIDGAWYLARLRPYSDRKGERAGVILKFVDITQLKTLQLTLGHEHDRLEGVLESQTTGYWDWDLNDETQFMSPRLKAMLGYGEDELDDRHEVWKTLIHEDDRSRILEGFDAHASSRGAVPFDDEMRLLHKDGAIIWTICRGKVIEWGEKGEPLRAVGCHFDITDLKVREQESLERADEIRRFSYISAHDLREPMSTIEGYLDIFQDELGDDLDPTHRRIMGAITRASERMRRQIEGVLEYAQLQDGELAFVPVDMTVIAEACLADLSSSIETAKAEVTIGNLPPAEGSATLVARVMQNLISNAIKFRHADKPPIITVEGRTDRNGMNSYHVTDNGIGIPPEARTKVFEVFARLHPRSVYEGTGLGMALCQKIVHQHGGSMSITDGPDGGTTVSFTLKTPSELPLTSKVA